MKQELRLRPDQTVIRCQLTRYIIESPRIEKTVGEEFKLAWKKVQGLERKFIGLTDSSSTEAVERHAIKGIVSSDSDVYGLATRMY